VTATDRTEPVAVDTVVTDEWIITLNAAREIYRDGAIAVSGGVITEVGKQADIVVFDTANFDLRPLHNPVANIVYGSTGHSVDTVLIGGEVVLRHKQLTSLDEAGLRSQVEAINRRVLGEIGIAPLPRWPIV